MSASWYVLRIKPHKERSVHQLLQSKDIRVYFPALKVEPTNPRAAKIRPYFPGYMFVHIDLDEEGENALRWTPGTTGLVRFGGVPATVPENLIQELKKRLARIEAAKEAEDTGLKPGDRVRIVDGPFAGYEAIFDAHLSGSERVRLLLTYLSEHPHRVTMGANGIEKLES
jgi:transcriptional antiterminator RfaH